MMLILHPWQVSDWFARIEREELSCKLDIILAYEVYSEPKAMMLYPINALRNLARWVMMLNYPHFPPFVLCYGGPHLVWVKTT